MSASLSTSRPNCAVSSRLAACDRRVCSACSSPHSGSVEIERLQFAPLELQQLALGGHRFGVLLQLGAAAVQGLPCLEQPAHLLRLAQQAGVAVQQVALRAGAQQRLVLVLPVDVEQEFARLAHLLHGGAAPVDEAARAPAAVHHAAQQAHALVALQFLLLQPLLQLRRIGDVEFRADLGALATRAHGGRIAALAQCQRQGIDQDGFARTGLAGQRGETG